MGGKVDETKQIAQEARIQSAAPPGFAPSAPFPDGGFAPQIPDPNAGFAPQFPDQSQFGAMSAGGFAAPADAFGRPPAGFAAYAGGFPAFGQPPPMPPF
jgi:hypothetical protein